MIITLGHKNPDTDSVISSFMLAVFLKKSGQEAKPALSGEVNKETKFIFSYFNEELPKHFSEEFSGQEKIFLVDHNDLSQSLVEKDLVAGIVDHHALAGFNSSRPIFFRVEPLGSSASLIYKMMKESGFVLEKKEAGMLLAAIISDTLKLNSPTTTDFDINILNELADISGENIDSLAEQMFAAKSDFSDLSLESVIGSDFKEFDLGGRKVAIAVSETTSLDFFEENKQEIVKILKKIKEEKSLFALFFGAVDIIHNNTWLFPATDQEKNIISQIFSGEDKGEFFFLPGIVSRKSQLLPPISDFFNKI